LDLFEVLVKSVCDFWLDKVKLPRIARKNSMFTVHPLVSENPREARQDRRALEDGDLHGINARPKTGQESNSGEEVNWVRS
jgi:hypothetical protein